MAHEIKNPKRFYIHEKSFKELAGIEDIIVAVDYGFDNPKAIVMSGSGNELEVLNIAEYKEEDFSHIFKNKDNRNTLIIIDK